jgi:tRNA (guanine-N7-)-methyltransferase
VRALLDGCPRRALDRVDLFYPDPWPKRRHWKRRFIVDDNVARLARAIRPGGALRFATDWGELRGLGARAFAALAAFPLDRRGAAGLARAVARLGAHAL